MDSSFFSFRTLIMEKPKESRPAMGSREIGFSSLCRQLSRAGWENAPPVRHDARPAADARHWSAEGGGARQLHTTCAVPQRPSDGYKMFQDDRARFRAPERMWTREGGMEISLIEPKKIRHPAPPSRITPEELQREIHAKKYATLIPSGFSGRNTLFPPCLCIGDDVSGDLRTV